MQSLPTLFLATATALLLAGTSACSKKEDPAPTPAPTKTGTYTLDNQTFTGTATYRTLKSYYASALLGDIALVNIYDGTTYDNSPRSATLTFFKVAGPDTQYQLLSVETITRTTTPYARRTYSDNLRFTLTQTTPNFSGTFSASSTSATASPATSTLASGQFTAVPE